MANESSFDGKRPTLQAIADEIGVTAMTVSKSLRGIGRISEETRRLVRDKAEEMGYFSSKDRLFPPFIRGVGIGDHRMRLLCPTIGTLDRGESVPYRNDMIAGLERALVKMGGEAVSLSFRSLEDLLDFLKRERTQGVALSEPFPVHWVRDLSKITPVVYTIGHDFESNVDSIFFNEARAASLIVNNLRRAGHRHIAFLGIVDRHASFLLPDEEFRGDEVADCLSHSGHGTRYASWLYLANQLRGIGSWPVCLMERDWRVASLPEVVQRGCRQILEIRPQPTAVVCVANAVAREAIVQFEGAGLRVPHDMSVVSYGVEESGNTADGHKLSGLTMPMDKVGELVPEVIQRRVAYPESLAVSIQLDAAWCAGETIRRIAQ